MKHFYGALKPKVDKRDYTMVAAGAQEFPNSFICDNLPPVKNQNSVNSCVAHATAAILETFNKTETGKFIPLSTDFIYGMQGVKLGRLDSGMYLRDACKIVSTYGDATEHSIGGNTEQPECTNKLKNKLTDEIMDEAEYYCINSYAQCKSANALKQALMNYGPVLCSIKWYDKYKFNQSVIEFDKTSNYGYHAVMICGWSPKGWICQNSWGRKWNGTGRFVYPFDEKFAEAWIFVDKINEEEIDIPNKNYNTIIDWCYKIVNVIINLLGKIRKDW